MFLTPDHLVRELGLKPGDRVCDLGCGTGAYAIALSGVVGDIGMVYAVDVHREQLSTLAQSARRQNLLNMEMLWADMEKGIPIDAYSLDAAVMSNVLFQLEDADRALAHVAKLLKPGGQLLVVDWSASHEGIGPHPDHVFSEEKAEAAVVRHGFRIVKRLPAGEYHYAFIAISS
jgi:ubiquinone/menaquinone biosynthesis C-methylase UbiE